MSERISIAMCTYNGARFLPEQLQSIAAQTCKPYELVVCDDGSSDSTRRILQEFSAAVDFPVRVFSNERKLGSTKNFEQAIKLCEGDIIALADQDDVWSPEKLARMSEQFAARPGVGLIFTDAELVDEKLTPLRQSLWNVIGFGANDQLLLRTGRAVDVFLPGWFVTGATLAFRAKYRDLVLDFPADLNLIHDGWLALIISAVAQVGTIETPLLKYRQHPLQQIGANEKQPLPTGLNGVAKAVRRRNPNDDLIKIAERARERLITRGALKEDDRVIRMLDARLTHLRTRDTLLRLGLPNRVALVVRELVTRRYHLYSNGSRSALKDVLGMNQSINKSSQ